MKQKLHFINQIILVLLLACGAGQVKGQYESFFGDSITTYNLWGEINAYYSSALCGETVTNDSPVGQTIASFLYKTDTVRIHDQLYYSVDRRMSWSPTNPYIREDTTTGQIFMYIGGNADREILICDMSLCIGDTFCVPNPDMLYYSDSCGDNPIVVDTIEYVNEKKIIHFQRTNTENVYFCDWGDPLLPIMFVEGVGPTYGPLGWDYISNMVPVLLCMYKDNELTFIFDENNLGCWIYPTPLVSENETAKLLLYPNPVKRNLNIRIDESIQGNGIIYISDIAGRVLQKRPLNNRNDKINMSSFSAGTYIVTYIENGKKISKKIIKK
ncbi:MAG: T9SS type A sorting domain-containing protein [Bacteroidales bacterium]|nr:T9SS type A sorting domain-containing protein [Bacteroidales bacterium]